MFTALPDRVHACVDDAHWLDASRQTLAEAFKQAGYRTVGFYSGPYLHPCFGLSQGFDSYVDCTSYSSQFLAKVEARTLLDSKGILGSDLLERSHQDITNPIVSQVVLRWLDGQVKEPFFLFIHFWDVHYDYIPPPPYDTMFDPDYRGEIDGRLPFEHPETASRWTRRDLDHLEALYDGEIRSTDETLGGILDQLSRRGLEDRSIIAVTADHGEAFKEHGFLGHRHTLFDEEIRIPLLIRYPGHVPANRRIANSARIIDVAPTLLSLAGVAPLPQAMGRSFLPLLRGLDRSWHDEPAYCELTLPVSHLHKFAVRDDHWKWIYDINTGRVSTFDLLQDPRERSPMAPGSGPQSASDSRQHCEDAIQRLDGAIKRLPPVGERDVPPISRLTEEQLRSLGYLR